MSDTGLKSQVVSSLRWIGAARLIGQLVSWAITILVIRLLKPSDYGLMAMANVVVGLLSMIAEMGFGATLIQPAKISREQIRQVFGAGILINTAITAFLIFTAPAIAAFYGEPRLIAVVQVASIQFMLSAAALVPDATLRRAMRFRPLSLIEIASGVVGNTSTLVLAYLGHGVWSLVLGGLIGGAVRCVLLYVTSGEGIAPSFRFRGAHGLFAFGANMTALRVLWYAMLQSDTLIAGKLLGKEAVGLYYVAVHLGSLPMQRVSSIINDVAFPAFAKIQHDKVAFAANLRLAVRMVSFVAFPMLWGLACVAPEVVHIATGDAWAPSIIPMQIIALSIPMRMVSSIISTATVSARYMKGAMVTSIANLLLALPAFYVGAQYGIVGLSIAWFFLVPVAFLINCLRVLPWLGTALRGILSEMVRSALAALLMAAALIVLRGFLGFADNGLRLVLLVLSGAITYAAATLLINRRAAFEAVDTFFPGRFAWLRRLRGIPGA